MSKYDALVQVHGNRLFLDNTQSASVAGRPTPYLGGAGLRGLRLFPEGQDGKLGNDYKIAAPVTHNDLFDDFVGKTLSTRFGTAAGSDGAAAAPAISAAAGGMVRGTTGAGAGASMAVNGVQLHSELNWKANAGGLVMEAKVKLSAITTQQLFVGFTDQVAALEAPIIGAGGGDGITTNATDAAGFLFDTTMTTTKFWCVGVANDVDGTSVNSGIAPVAATYNTLRVEIDTAGTATFYIDGVLVGTVATAVTPTVALTPVIAGFSRAAASRTIDADYVFVQQRRA